MKFCVQGTYIMKFFVDVNKEVDAEDETEAIEKVQNDLSAGQAYDQECEWANVVPNVTKEK